MKHVILTATIFGLALAASCDSDSSDKEGPDDGSAATGGASSGNGGSSGNRGGSSGNSGGSSGNSGGSSGSSGNSGGSSGNGGEDAGGDGGDAGRTGGAGGGDAGSPGEGGQAGEPGGGGAGPGVTARVVSEVNLPLAGITVMIGGETLVTNAAGEVTFAGVPETYDAVAINPERPFPAAMVYRGLTRRDPVFHFSWPEGTEHAPTLAGTTDVPGTESVELLFGTSELWKVTRALNDGSFSLLPRWSGPTSTTGTLHLLRWNVTNGAPSSYTGYGSTAVTMTAANQQVTLQATPIASGSVSGTLLVPGSSSGMSSRAFYAVLDAHTQHHITSQTSASPVFENVVTPAIPGAKIQIWGGTGSTGNYSVRSIRHYPTTASNIELDIPTGPTLTSPADAATGVTTNTPFVWSPLGGAAGVCIVEIRRSNGRIRIVTSETTTTIPNVPGYELPADTSIDWTVLCYAPFDDVDAFAAPEADIDIPEFKRLYRLRRDMQYGSAFPRGFRTAP